MYLPDLRIYNEPLFTEFIEENVERKPYSTQKKKKKKHSSVTQQNPL